LTRKANGRREEGEDCQTDLQNIPGWKKRLFENCCATNWSELEPGGSGTHGGVVGGISQAHPRIKKYHRCPTKWGNANNTRPTHELGGGKRGTSGSEMESRAPGNLNRSGGGSDTNETNRGGCRKERRGGRERKSRDVIRQATRNYPYKGSNESSQGVKREDSSLPKENAKAL